MYKRQENIRGLLTDDDATLLKDLPSSAVVRMLHHLYEKGNFNPNFRLGRKYLRGMLQRLPDNKLVEDIHLPIKRDAKSSGIHTRQRPARIQEKILTSNPIEARGIPHPAEIDKVTFERELNPQRAHFKLADTMPLDIDSLSHGAA